MFDTDLTRDYEAAASLGLDPRAAFEAGILGALCEEDTKTRLWARSETTDWPRTTATLGSMDSGDVDGQG
jgi:aminodeoxyfutalosine deaminase